MGERNQKSIPQSWFKSHKRCETNTAVMLLISQSTRTLGVLALTIINLRAGCQMVCSTDVDLNNDKWIRTQRNKLYLNFRKFLQNKFKFNDHKTKNIQRTKSNNHSKKKNELCIQIKSIFINSIAV